MDYTPETKVCSKCGIEKSISEYSKDKYKKSGYKSQCKECGSKANRAWRDDNQEHLRNYRIEQRDNINTRRRVYRKQPHVQEKEREYERKSRESGRRQELARKRYADNPEHFRAKRRDYYVRNREEENRKSREFRANNPAYFREQARQWREENRERHNENVRNWHKNNPIRSRAITARRWARMHNAEGTHDAQDIRDLLQAQDRLCAYCKADLSNGYHVDHIRPVSRGGRNDVQNLAITCPFCNVSKHDKTLIEWAQTIEDDTILENIYAIEQQWITDHADDNGQVRLFD